MCRRARHFGRCRVPARSLRLGELGQYPSLAHLPFSKSRLGELIFSAEQDVTQLVGRKQDVLDQDLLWTRIVGQEQVRDLPLIPTPSSASPFSNEGGRAIDVPARQELTFVLGGACDRSCPSPRRFTSAKAVLADRSK